MKAEEASPLNFITLAKKDEHVFFHIMLYNEKQMAKLQDFFYFLHSLTKA
jgi:hypothetical protein